MFEIVRTKKQFHSYFACNFSQMHKIFCQQINFAIVIIKNKKSISQETAQNNKKSSVLCLAWIALNYLESHLIS